MAKTDLFGRLADLSEEAIQKLSDAPGADRAVQALNTLRARVDELQKRVRGLEELEKRLTALEHKVDKLSKGSSASSQSRSTSSSPAPSGSKTTSTKSSGASEAQKD
jgi:TolA-binding protein